jgi:uncharacterized protein YgiB involved in biofilm formation
MKRSQAIRLGLMGAGLTAVVALAFCDEDSVSAAAYESVDQCAAGGRFTRAACERAFDDASAEHLRASPRYARREDCEAEFGADGCSTMTPPGAAAAGAATLFVPAMAGFLLANAASSGLGAQPLYRPCLDSNDPQCRGRGTSSGGTVGGGGARWFYTASGDRVAAKPGDVSVGRSVLSGRAASTTLARGGFGARAAAHAAS